MKTKIILIGILLVFLSGCDKLTPETEEGITYMPLYEETEESYDDCEILRKWDRIETDHFPKNITIDNIILTFENLTKKDYFGLSETIYKKTNGLVRIDLFDNYLLIRDEKDYWRCEIGTINRLIELNATDILYEICIAEPRLTEIWILANDLENHTVKVCWD